MALASARQPSPAEKGTEAQQDKMNEWERIKARLAVRIAGEAYNSWILRTSMKVAEGSVLCVNVPDQVTKQWLEQALAEDLRSVMEELNLPFESVVYEVDALLEYQTATVESDGTAVESFLTAAPGQLNPRFTFDNFVVGSCNQFAHAAAKAVATNPSRRYNPLFIYGGVGMGKTHLMHAIGRSLLDQYKSMRVVYTSSERFMNEMISCIKSQRMPQFHRYYRSADVLLVDDVQILGGKERTQEEFFHTFNELYDSQKQIVISSDSPPKSISGLVERLRSRFEWGLIVDIQPPDLETKMAILDRKAEAEGMSLPDDVRIYIATKMKSNVRELEGALIKLIAYSSMTETPINLAIAQQVLKHLIPGQERRITIESIFRVVADRYSLQPAQLKQKSNSQRFAFPRQVAMYLAKELTQSSLPEIGRAFGGKHHTTVLHSIQKIEQLRHKNPDLNRTIHSLIDSIH